MALKQTQATAFLEMQQQEVFEEVVVKLFEKRFTASQKQVFAALQGLAESTMTQASEQLAVQLACDASTVLKNLAIFRDCGLIACGSKEDKNIPLEFTGAGKAVLRAAGKGRE